MTILYPKLKNESNHCSLGDISVLGPKVFDSQARIYYTYALDFEPQSSIV